MKVISEFPRASNAKMTVYWPNYVDEKKTWSNLVVYVKSTGTTVFLCRFLIRPFGKWQWIYMK